MEAKLVSAPNVPAPITRTEPAHVMVNLVIEEKVADLSEGIQYDFWTYNGKVPGPFIRLRQGDTFEVRLDNSKGKTHAHRRLPRGHGARRRRCRADGGSRQDLHRSLQGAQRGLLRITTARAPPVPAHISSGLYGVILVEPAGGMPKVDREYYVMQSEFYTEKELGEPGLQSYSSEKGEAETPEYIVFNGHTQSLIGDGALKADVGETVRLYVGNIGPNKISSFHVIGEIFDAVYREGSVSNPEKNIQTTLIPSGSASIVEFKGGRAGGLPAGGPRHLPHSPGGLPACSPWGGAEQPDIYAVKQSGTGAM